MNTRLVIFDLDGTLLNTIGDLAVACTAVLERRGLPLHTYAEYCHFVGNGIMRLVERALPEPMRTPETVAAVRADFVKYYTEHIDAHTQPYAGIPELVAELGRRGVAMAVASNKFQAGTEKLIRLFFPGVAFAAVFGQRPDVPLKPDPAASATGRSSSRPGPGRSSTSPLSCWDCCNGFCAFGPNFRAKLLAVRREVLSLFANIHLERNITWATNGN